MQKTILSNYNLNKYVKSQLEAINVTSESEHLNEIEKAIKVAVGSTPQTINRIINLYSLSETILSSNETNSNETKKLDLSLMYLTILRCAFPLEYRKLDALRGSYIKKLIDSDDDENSDNEFASFAKILKTFLSNAKQNRILSFFIQYTVPQSSFITVIAVIQIATETAPCPIISKGKVSMGFKSDDIIIRIF